MKKILFTVFILFSAITSYCQHSYVQDLRSEAQITFPDTPKVNFEDGATYYRYNNGDVYFAESIDISKNSSDSISSHMMDLVYDKFIYSTINPLNGDVFHEEKISLKGIKGVAFNYKCSLKGQSYYAYQQAFRLRNTFISYSLLSPDSLSAGDKRITSFFETFKVTPEKAAKAEKNSAMMAGIFLTCAAIFWGAVIFYVINRKKKKKSYEWIEGQ